MAEPPGDISPDRSDSPNEDFDPLHDNRFHSTPVEATPDEHMLATGEDADFGDYYDLIDAQLEENQNLCDYGVTPPQPRIYRREKERQSGGSKGSNGRRSYKDEKDQQARSSRRKNSQPRAVLNIIKDAHVGDPALCKLSGFDSDDNFDAESFREKRSERRKRESRDSKKQTKSRDLDRSMKSMSGDFSGLDVGGMAQVPVKLESSGRFSHLVTKPVSPEVRVRREWTEPAECPSDRRSFSKTFSMLIKLGTQAKMDKEKKLASATKRQMSTEQEQWKSQIMELMWLELNAYLHGISYEDEVNVLVRDRKEMEKVLDDIMHFQFRKRNLDSDKAHGSDPAFVDAPLAVGNGAVQESNLEVSTCRSASGGAAAAAVQFRKNGPVKVSSSTSSGEATPTPRSSLGGGSGSGTTFDENGLAVQLDEGVSASFRDVILTAEMVQLQQEALVQVQTLVDRLDMCERLFPTMRHIATEFHVYGEAEFVRRVKCLNLWLNITCDLCHKLKLFGRIIGVEQHGIEWPDIKFDFPFPHDSDRLVMQRASVGNLNSLSETTSDSDLEELDEHDVDDSVTETERLPARNSRFLSPIKQVKFQFGSDRDSCASSRDTSPNQRVIITAPTSPVEANTPSRNSRSSMGSCGLLSRASSDLSLDGVGRSWVYRHYVDKCLKKMGMQKLVVRLRDIFNCTLQRAKEALESPRHSEDLKRYPSEEACLHENELASSPSMNKAHMYFGRSTSLAEHGEWCQEFRRMGLPSFRPLYLFLVRVPLDVVHECLRLRLEQRPQGEPSDLSIRQLIRECREVLYAATLVKQYYQFMVDPVMLDEQEAEEKFASDLELFDQDLKQMLEVYFSFLQSWIYMLQSLPESSQHLNTTLEDEWNFTRGICIYIIGGEAEAGKRFSALASSLLSSTADFLDNGIDENTRCLYDISTAGEDGDDDDDSDDMGMHDSNNNSSTPSIEYDDYSVQPRIGSEVKQTVQVALRNFKNLFHEARERATKALSFAKKLRKDLEIAADFNVIVPMTELFEKLKDTYHVRVRVTLSAGYMMFVPSSIASETRQVLHLLNVTSGRDDPASVVESKSKEHSLPVEEGYLLLVRCESGTDHVMACPQWTGRNVLVETKAETAIALSHIQVEGLLYVVTRSSVLSTQRQEFEQLMGSSIKLVCEQTPCHQAIAESLSEVKLNALMLQEKVAEAVRQVDDKLNLSNIIQHEDNLLKLYRETMLQCYNFGFEYSKEVMRLISTDQRQRQCHTLVQFAGDWMKFVLEKCERGRGTRPRWATQGLDFLTAVCDPRFLAYLTNEDFEKFKQTISDCLTHVIGTMEQRAVTPGISINRSTVELRPQQSYGRFISWQEHGKTSSFVRTTSTRSEPISHSASTSGFSTPSTPSPLPGDSRARRFLHESHSEVNIHDGPDGGLELDIHHKNRASTGDAQLSRSGKIRQEIQQMEKKREATLREKKRIGSVTNKVRETDYRISVRRVNFRWQRGNKIGEGQFGKVYTAVNMSTGELMAIKEMKFQPNDLQQLREICDEIKIFEGIQHPNLVKYYGVEVHKDEMLMFMEYCDTGTIEEAAKMGLPEYLIRRYTRELVLAVNHLHENSIVHRDIKGANIFLTSNGHVKLGDFGCSVKLKSHTTMPGEFHSLVGTTAYMAPEVITQNDQSGYGRAADIWSIGCVVIEMATGKRPWHELENNYQIMFKVGMGQRPVIPDSLSPEGIHFLDIILCHDPAERPTASQLLDHSFMKVYNETEEEEDDKKKRHHHPVHKEPSDEA